MSIAQVPPLAPYIINGAHEVASYHAGKGIIDVIWDCFTSGKIQCGDYLLSRSSSLIQQHYPSLPAVDQKAIIFQLKMTIQAKENLEMNRNTSIFQSPSRRSLANDYKQVAQELFIIVERASQRTANKSLLAQLEEASNGGDPPPPPPPTPPPIGPASTISNPFLQSHEVPSLADVDIRHVNEVEMTVFKAGTTGDAAAIFDLRGRDASRQQVFATFSPEFIMADGRHATSEALGEVPSAPSVRSSVLYGSRSEDGDDTGR